MEARYHVDREELKAFVLENLESKGHVLLREIVGFIYRSTNQFKRKDLYEPRDPSLHELGVLAEEVEEAILKDGLNLRFKKNKGEYAFIPENSN